MNTEQLANVLYTMLEEHFKDAQDITIVPEMFDKGSYAVELKLDGKMFLFMIEDTTELQ